MKNRVLRLAIVAVLVIAMVLTMAACGQKPVESPSTTPSTQPTTAPTTAPTTKPTTAPTTSPAPTSDAATLAKDAFGIELVGLNSKYTVYNNAGYGNAELKQYIFLNFDAAKLAGYTVTAKVTSISYEGEALDTAAVNAMKTAGTNGIVKVYKKDDGKWAETDNWTADQKTYGYAYAIPVTKAGTYEVEVNVKVVDNTFDYAQFGHKKVEDSEFDLTATAVIEKALAYVMVAADVAKVDADPSGLKQPDYAPVNVTTGSNNAYIYANGALSTLANTEWETYLGTNTAYVVEANRYAVNEAGEVALNMIISSASSLKYGDEEKLVDLAELSAPNFNFQIMPATKYIVSAYDWNAIGDVITSALEIKDATATGVNQYKLAMNRYNALSDAQKAYFIRYNDFTDDGFLNNTALLAADANEVVKKNGVMYDKTLEVVLEIPGSKVLVGDYEYATADSVEKTSASLMIWLTIMMPAVMAQVQVLADFVTAVEDAGYDDIDGSVNVANDTMVAVYNKVAAYLAGLSAADLKVIKANAGLATVTGVVTGQNADAKTYYTNFVTDSTAMSAASVHAVEELIAGAVGAYNRAIVNANGKYVYTLTAGLNAAKYFINNSEVKALTAQARAAYDKLTKAEQASIKVDFDTAEGALGGNFFNGDTAGKISYVNALKALEAMNAAVGYMEQIISYANVESYAHTAATTTIYGNLNSLLYGIDAKYGSTDELFTNNHFAMSDILSACVTANGRYLPEVIAEYKAWVDELVKFEAYKAEIVANLNAQIAETFVVGDYTEIQVEAALYAKNTALVALKDRIMNESTAALEADGAETLAANSPVVTEIVRSNFKAIANKTSNSKLAFETFEEFEELFESVYNVDKAFTFFQKNYNVTIAD